MFVRWKHKCGEKCDMEGFGYVTYRAELYKSIRTGKKVQQKYVAYLGGIGCSEREVEYELDRLAFWSKAWRKLHELGITGDELQRIEDNISRRLPKPNMCFLLRPRQRKILYSGFDEWYWDYRPITENLTWTPEVKGTLSDRMYAGK